MDPEQQLNWKPRQCLQRCIFSRLNSCQGSCPHYRWKGFILPQHPLELPESIWKVPQTDDYLTPIACFLWVFSLIPLFISCEQDHQHEPSNDKGQGSCKTSEPKPNKQYDHIDCQSMIGSAASVLSFHPICPFASPANFCQPFWQYPQQ